MDDLSAGYNAALMDHALSDVMSKFSKFKTWGPFVVALMLIALLFALEVFGAVSQATGKFATIKQTASSLINGALIVTLSYAVTKLSRLQVGLYKLNVRSGSFIELLQRVLRDSRTSDKKIERLDIVDVDGKDYADVLKSVLSDNAGESIKISEIAKLRVLLCRHSDFRVDKETAEANKNALSNARNVFNDLHNNKKIKKMEIRYMDTKLMQHFCVVNGNVMFGGTFPIGEEARGTDRETCHVSKDNDVVSGHKKTFNSWFDLRGFYDSGLMERDRTVCPNCCGHMLDKITSSDGWENKPLFNDKTQGEDFYIVPDIRPISKIHLVLICKYHVLNFYDYMKRSHLMNDKDREPGAALIELIENIRSSIKTRLGEKQEILVFEHGSLNPGSPTSAPSIDHLHLHVILRPTNCLTDTGALDTKKIFSETEYVEVKEGNVVDIKKYRSIVGFAHDPSMGNSDYFLIWDPSGAAGSFKIYVALKKKEPDPNVKFSQYLRGVFYKKLEATDVKDIYGTDAAEKYKTEKKSDKTEIWFNDKTRFVARTDTNKALYDELKWPDTNN